MSHPIDQIDNPHTKPLQMVHDGQLSSGKFSPSGAATAIDEIHRHVV